MNYGCITLDRVISDNSTISYKPYMRSYYLKSGPSFQNEEMGEIDFEIVNTLR